MRLSQRELGDILAHAEEGYPDEVCGIVIGRADDPETNVIRRCVNIANRYHQEDPVRFPRDAKTAYVMDPRDLFSIQREADSQGLDFVLLYHSHTDHEAYFSATDRELALLAGEPLWPHARYMVVSVKNQKASYYKVFMWDDLRRDFIEAPFSVSHENA